MSNVFGTFYQIFGAGNFYSSNILNLLSVIVLDTIPFLYCSSGKMQDFHKNVKSDADINPRLCFKHL